MVGMTSIMIVSGIFSLAETQCVSERGILFVATWEGFRRDVYLDVGGNCTIAHGHLLCRAGKCTGNHGEFSRGISRGRALDLLEQDLDTAERAVRWHVIIPLSQNEFDALVSFTFNVGAEAFCRSTLLKRLNAGDKDSVPGELARWTLAGGKHVEGLANRRAAEGQLFMQPDAPLPTEKKAEERSGR